ncbi:MAG TPA: hypothetical protein VIY73_00490, partial [Polyangiaceae bacterium]
MYPKARHVLPGVRFVGDGDGGATEVVPDVGVAGPVSSPTGRLRYDQRALVGPSPPSSTRS